MSGGSFHHPALPCRPFEMTPQLQCCRDQGLQISAVVSSQLIGRTTSRTASRITLWPRKREMRTLMSDQKVKKKKIPQNIFNNVKYEQLAALEQLRGV